MVNGLKKSIITGGVALAMMCAAAPAIADAMQYPAHNWTGPYVGGHLGWAQADWKIDGPRDIFDQGPFSISLKDSGVFGGGTIGYNWQLDEMSDFGALVLGIEGDFGYLGIDKTSTFNADNDTATQDYGWYGTITGRLGLAAGSFLPYLKGGIAFAEVDLFAADVDNFGAGDVIDPRDATTSNKTRTGYVIGGGLEYAFMNGWSAKAEYLYMDFGSTNSTNIDTDIWTHRNEVHTVKVGINVQLETLFGAM